MVCEVRWKMVKGPIQWLVMAALVSSGCAQASWHETEHVSEEIHHVRCARRLVTTVWGCIVTLLALGLDSWGRYKHTAKGKVDTVIIFVLGALNPFISFWGVADDAVDYVRMLSRLKKPMFPSCLPWGKCVVKIIVPSDVIINGLPPSMYENLQSLKSIVAADVEVHDYSNAIVIGSFKNELVNFLALSLEGKEALLRAEVLPAYDELKKLHGHSRLGVVLSFIQATGYIYGVVFRLVEGLHVTPVEVICVVLNLLLLMKVTLHHFSSFLHKPLVLHLDNDSQERFWKECQKVEYRFTLFSSHLSWCVALSSVGFAAILVGFIVGMAKHPLRLYFPVILFLVTLLYTGLTLQTLVLGTSQHSALLELAIYVMNGISYVFALAVTGEFWVVEELNLRSSHPASELFPHIGCHICYMFWSLQPDEMLVCILQGLVIPAVSATSSIRRNLVSQAIRTGDIEKALQRVLSLEDVKGLLLLDQDGNVLRNTMPVEHAQKYATEIPALTLMCRSAAREIEAKDDLTMLRIKSRKHELMIVVDDRFTLMVLQEYPGFWIEPSPPPPTPPRDSDDEFFDDDEEENSAGAAFLC